MSNPLTHERNKSPQNSLVKMCTRTCEVAPEPAIHRAVCSWLFIAPLFSLLKSPRPRLPTNNRINKN